MCFCKRAAKYWGLGGKRNRVRGLWRRRVSFLISAFRV